MAEARSAAMMSLATSQHSVHFDVHETGITIHIPRTWYTPRLIRRSLAKHAHRFRNRVQTALWPAHPALVALIVVVFMAYVAVQPLSSWWRSGPVASFLWSADSLLLHTFCPGMLCDRMPVQFRVGYLAAVAAFLFIAAMMLLQRIFLRVLLHYRGWLYERRPGIITKWWAVLLRGVFLAGRHPLLYSFQHALPRQAPPPVKHTVGGFLASVKPLLTDKQYADMVDQAQKFQSTVATRLNTLLWLKSWWSTNYVSDWWLQYVYLRGRSPLLIQSNYYVPARAANVASLVVSFFRKVDRETVDPMLIRGTVPLCMAQYQYLFSTVREPGKECDKLRHYDSTESKHFVVTYRGVFYTVDVATTDSAGVTRDLTPAELQVVLQDLMNSAAPATDANGDVPPVRRLGALTTMERTEWATTREAHFSSGFNKASLSAVERAIFILALDEGTPETLTHRGQLAFYGNGTDRWCDKSVSYIVFANGALALHAEHSWGDAPVAAHSMEHILLSEAANHDMYDADGNVTGFTVLASTGSGVGVGVGMGMGVGVGMGMGVGVGVGVGAGAGASGRQSSVVTAQPLSWHMTDALAAVVNKATVSANEAIDDLELEVMEFNDYGKGLLKKAGVPPDGFIQMALQLAFYRDSAGHTPLTYESAMTRMFREGRTETIRSVSSLSVEFVRAMEDSSKANAEKLGALKAAATNHQATSRHAMSGLGVDRHLFALYVMSLGLGYEVPFLKNALSMPWQLSTSQLPQRQTTMKVQSKPGETFSYASPSGGFGPVADNGYGVSYMVADDHHTFFHVSSKRHTTNTSSKRFVQHLQAALMDMKQLLEEES